MTKPDLILPSGSVTITECADSLFGCIATHRDLFMRGGAIQELARDDDGSLYLSVVRPEAFRSRIENYVRVKRWHAVKGEFQLADAICPDETAKALMASQPAARRLPRIRGIASCPVAAKGPHDASGLYPVLALGKGYHEDAGGILVTDGAEIPYMPINEAVGYIKGMLDEFEFNSNSDRARATAMLITPALRIGGWLRGHCPIFVIEANASQTGKGYLLNLLSTLYSENPSMIGHKEGGVGSLDESISSAMLAGRPFIQFDNMRGRMASAFLEMVITAGGLVPCRVPHRGEVSVDSSYFTFTMTSNGVETTQDLANRACIIRIRKREGYAFRTYEEGDLRAHIKANQSRYLAAVFAVVKAWAEVGCARNQAENRHDFREWAQTLDFICRNILQESPLMDGHDGAKESTSNPALVWLRAVAIAIERAGRMEEAFTAGALAELCDEQDINIPACHDASEEARRKRVGVMLKRLILDPQNSIEFDAYKVERKKEEKYFPDESRYREIRLYHFSRQKS